MALWDRVAHVLALEPLRERSTLFETTAVDDFPDLDTQLANLRRYRRGRPWRTASVENALGVPAIQRACTLIAQTTGSLAMQGFRNGVLMPDAPKVIARPNPYGTPRDAYRDMAWTLATRGETILYIAARDSDNNAAALIQAPNLEVHVEENPDNRLRPIVRWGDITSTWYSTAYPAGQFVHITYVKELGDLRGKGPLQMNKAAVSVSVEAQEWAANFFAEGGYPSTIIKAAGQLSEDPETGVHEADTLRNDWMSRDHNTPRIIDEGIESVETLDVNQQGAQMLEAREHQNGDASRMFGIPGSLLEFSRAGSSLTYQNLESEFTKFVKTCLAPGYLEPIEQALSDLLPRSTVARFNVKGFLRADAKTRAEIYEKLIPMGVMTSEDAQREEGYSPGDVEYAPIPFAPPQAIPSAIPFQRSLEDLRCKACGRLAGRIAGPAEIKCSRCGQLVVAA